MFTNPFVEQRKLAKLQLLEMIKQHGELEKERLIALFSLKSGLKTATIKDYWEELEACGIVENGGVNYPEAEPKGSSETAQSNVKQNIRNDDKHKSARKKGHRHKSKVSKTHSRVR